MDRLVASRLAMTGLVLAPLRRAHHPRVQENGAHACALRDTATGYSTSGRPANAPPAKNGARFSGLYGLEAQMPLASSEHNGAELP